MVKREKTAVEICGVTLKTRHVKQSITTRYVPATDTRGSRVSATTATGIRKIGHFDDALTNEMAHWQVAAALANSLGWSGEMVCGGLKNGYVFVFVK